MNNPVKLSVGVVFGLICGAMIGTIIGSAYLTLALWRGVAGFDMFSVWTASEVMRAMHPEAFKVAFGAVALFALGLGFLAFVWSWRKQRDESPRVYRREFCSNVRRRYQEGSSLHRSPPPLLVA